MIKFEAKQEATKQLEAFEQGYQRNVHYALECTNNMDILQEIEEYEITYFERDINERGFDIEIAFKNAFISSGYMYSKDIKKTLDTEEQTIYCKVLIANNGLRKYKLTIVTTYDNTDNNANNNNNN